MGITITALVGDGDSRLRKIQYERYMYFPTSFSFLEKTEFPLVLGFGLEGDFPMQDILHDIKKERNCAKYLSTKLLLMCSHETLTFQNRLRYVVRWDVVVWCWENSEDFRDI